MTTIVEAGSATRVVDPDIFQSSDRDNFPEFNFLRGGGFFRADLEHPLGKFRNTTQHELGGPMRVAVVVSSEVYGSPLAALLRQGGVKEVVAIVTSAERLADLVNTGGVDVVFIGTRAVHLLDEARETITVEARAAVRFALATSHQNNEVLRMAAEAGFDGVVDMHQDRVAIHQQLRNLMLMSGEWSILPTTPSPEQMFFASRDTTDRLIVERVTFGMTDKQIADDIHLAPQTVRNRLSKMMTDAGLNNRTHLATYWLREQLLAAKRTQNETAVRGDV